MNTSQLISRIRKNLNVCTDELYEISKLFRSNVEEPYYNSRKFKPLDQRLKLRSIYAEIIVNELVDKECISDRIKDKAYKILKPIINDIIDDIIDDAKNDINDVSKIDLITYALVGKME